MKGTRLSTVKSAFPFIAGISILVFVGTLFAIEVAEFVERKLPFDLLFPAIRDSNLMKYIFGLFVFVVVFFGIYLLVYYFRFSQLQTWFTKEIKTQTYQKRFLLGLLAVSTALLLRRFYFELNDNGIDIASVTFHQLPAWAALALIIPWSVLSLYFSYKKKDIPPVCAYICYGLVIILTFISSLVLNVYNADSFHGVAYIESIYNVYHMVPYTEITTGIYGHYGLFFGPLLHLLDNSNVVLMLLISLTSCLTVGFCIYCIHNITTNNLLRVLCILACCATTLTIRKTNYWQCQPHRVLFPVIVIAYVIMQIKHNRWHRKNIAIGYLICVLACVWNVECGLFCTIAYALAIIAHSLRFNKWYRSGLIMQYALHIACIVATMAGAILIVNIYNFLCGYDKFILKEFFFPLYKTEYMEEILKMDIQLNLDAWVFVVVLFSIVLLTGLYYTTFFNKVSELAENRFSKFAPLLIAVGVLGLTNYSYYANRAAYLNLDIILQIACIAMCLLWELFCRYFEKDNHQPNNCKKLSGSLIAATCVLVVAVLALQTILFSLPQIKKKYEAGHYELQSFYEACALIEEKIPRDTFAFGGGISTMYNELDWDTVGYYRDRSDYTIDGNAVVSQIAADAQKHDRFLVFGGEDAATARFNGVNTEEDILAMILSADPSYQLETELTIYNIPLRYYVRTNTTN